MDWGYNDLLQIVTHDPHVCGDCTAWVTHYTHSTAICDRSLLAAKAEHTNAALGTTAVSSETTKELRSEIRVLRKDLEQSRDEHNHTREDLANVCRELDDVYRKYENADKEANCMHRCYDDLEETSKRDQESIASLQQQVEALEHGQVTRHRKITQSSYSPSLSALPRTGSPMRDDRDLTTSRPLSGTFPLLSRLAVPAHPASAPASTSASATLSPLLLGDLPPPSSSEASPAMPVSLLTRMTDDTHENAPEELMPMIPSSPYAEHVGFYSLLPVFTYHNNTWAYDPTTVETDSSGGPDLSNHPFFILAMDGSPQWTTTLVRREHYTAAEAVAARTAKLGIPL
jgi:hypothetical protein